MNCNNNNNNNNKVCIVGIGFRLPSSYDGPKELFDQLLYGFDGIVETSERWSDNFNKVGEISTNTAGLISTDQLKLFDPLFFGINPSEIKIIDPQQRLLLKCVWEALEDALIDPFELRGSNTSVITGTSSIDYHCLNIDKNETHSNILSSSSSSLSNRISYCFDLRGESITIDTACSSSSNAIKYGYQSIINGNSNVSIVCGSNLILDPSTSKSFTQLNMLSKSSNGRCKSFDADADGYVRADAIGVVVLKNLNQAITDGNNIYCIIDGVASNVDGSGIIDKSNFYSPSWSSQSDCIKLAIKSTNGLVTANDICFVEAHGTGTPIGDPIEMEGIANALGTSVNRSPLNPLLIGSIKSNFGHSEAASGVSSLIKCCLMYKYQCIVPNLHFQTPNPKIKFNEWNLKVVTDAIQFSDIKRLNNQHPISMAINNFGITGSNVCLILSQHIGEIKKQIPTSTSLQKKYLIPFSANTNKSLQNYLSLIKNDGSIEFDEFVKLQIQSKTTKLIQRSVILAGDWNEFKDASSNNFCKSSNEKLSSNMVITSNKQNVNIVFVFVGQGTTYTTMGKQLYENDLTFKKSMDLIDCKFSKYYGYSILDKLRSINENDIKSLNEQELAQPTTCMIQISLFELYKHWGIKPSFIIGHSLGEMTAAYCSGMIDLDTCCYLIYHRSMEQRKTNGLGKVLVININESEFISKYSIKYPSIEIACYNSPLTIAISGNENELIEISLDLKSNEIFSTMLPGLTSFHSSSQLLIKNEILSLSFNSKSPTIPIFSTVTTSLFDEINTQFNSEYIFENIIKPVQFEQTISNLYKHIESNNLGSEIIFLEISPTPTLYFHLKQNIPKHSEYFNNGSTISVFSPLSKKGSNDLLAIQKTISQIYCNGYNGINFKCQFNNSDTIVCNSNTTGILPLYQWDENEYWRVLQQNQIHINQGPPTDHLGVQYNSPNVKSYQALIDIAKPPFQWLKGHIIRGKFYFPGTGYINNIFKIYGNGKSNSLSDIRISSMEFKSPFILVEGGNQYLQTNIHSTGKKEFRVLFHYKNQISNEWVQACYGNLQLFNNNGGDGSENDDFNNFEIKYNIEDLILKKCNLIKLSKNELYSQIKVKTGINYIDSFQRVEECYIGNNCSLSIISLHLEKDEPQSSFFNTSILDSFFHGMIGLIDEQSTIVFEKVEGIIYYSTRIPIDRNQYSHLYVYSESNSRIGDSISGSIKVLLLDGTLIYEMEKATCKSITPIKDSLSIEYPTNKIFTMVEQSKDSLISTPSSFNSIYIQDKLKSKSVNNVPELLLFTSCLLYTNIVKRCHPIDITIDQIKSMEMNQLLLKYFKHSTIVRKRLFIFVFNFIKSYYKDGDDGGIGSIDNNDNNKQILIKTTSIMAKQLFPLENDNPLTDTPHSLYENGLLDKYYEDHACTENLLVSEIIQESIKSILNEKIVFRILEFGGGLASLSIIVLDKIEKLLLDNPNYQIDIEYTWSDISPSFIQEAKSKFSKYNNIGINILYKILDLENPLIGGQGLNPSYYDYIIMANVLHVIKQVKYGINQIYQLLSTNGHLLFIEPTYESYFTDVVFSVFDQWWSFEDTEIRQDSCKMKKETWLKLLIDCNFNSDIKISDGKVCFVIQAQKHSILGSPTSTQLIVHDEIIVFGNNGNNSNLSNHFLKSLNQPFYLISNIQEFNGIISKLTNNSIIYFIKCIDQLSINNFKEITFEYIQINQLLLKLNSTCKHVLITCDSQSNNYLSSSVIGSARYFDEFPQLELFTLNFDSVSIGIENLISKIIQPLTNSSTHIQREFLIKNHIVYYDRFKLESNIKNTFKNSNSFQQIENDDDNEKFIISLSPNLEYQLQVKPIINLENNQVEILVLANGLNYKDYLVYAGLLPPEIANQQNGDINKPHFGNELSGIVTKVGGSGCNNEFKVGDHVFGISFNTTSSHIVTDINYIEKKPLNITHLQASSIPAIYVTSYHSLYNIGGLENDESILIHTATGGIGLSTLEILKWKKHTGLIFCTVGSIDKQQYLTDNYGDFITGIYSTRNKNYVDQIKLKIKHLNGGDNGNGGGIDLILNTLSSSDYMDSNFKCLNSGGRIIDLTITHLNSNEFTENRKFKYNFGYHNVELILISKKIIKRILKKLVVAIENQNLKIIPSIIEYQIENLKQGIEYLNSRNHIGKIVIDHLNQDKLKKQLIENHKQINQLNYSSTLLKSDYQIQTSVLGSNIILTGQTGIILEILKWILKYSIKDSIKNIIILSKSLLKWELNLIINKCKQDNSNLRNIKFHFKSIDIGNEELVDNSISEILLNNPDIKNIDSIFHYAFIQTQCEVEEISMNYLNESHNPKTFGAINLHNQSIKRNWKLINFVMASSIVSLIGSNLQCSYVSSNCVIDSLSKYRKSIGLPSISTNYGVFGNTGFVSRNDSIQAMLSGCGLENITINHILGTLDLQLQNPTNSTNTLLFDLKYETFLVYFKQHRKQMVSKFDYMFNIFEQNQKTKIFQSSGNEVSDMVISKISETLSIDPSKLNTSIRLNDYGADSLVIIQFSGWVQKQFSLTNREPTIQQLQNKTIQQVIEIIENSINKKKLELQQSTQQTIQSTQKQLTGIEFWKNEMKIDDLLLFKETLPTPTTTPPTQSSNQDKCILLTGSTGYIGGYILSKIIQLSSCSVVYCLIRNKSNSLNKMNEIIGNLKYHKLYDQLNQEHLSKIIVIVGDLSMDKFGITNDEYSILRSKVNLIINSGAAMDLNIDYQSSKLVNVNSVKELIKLSISSTYQSTPIKIAHLSTVGIFSKQKLKDGQEFDETLILPSIDNIDNLVGYGQSKVIAEYILMNSSKSFNISSMILRLPSVFANPITGIGSKSDIFQLLFTSCYDIGYFPTPPNTNFLISPITWITNNLMNLVLNENCWSATTTTNIYNIHGDSQSFLFQPLTKFNCKEISHEKWKQMVLESNNKSCIALKTLHSLDDLYAIEFDKGISISKNTKSLLQSLGSYGNDDCEDDNNLYTWKVTNKMMKNYIDNWNLNKYK